MGKSVCGWLADSTQLLISVTECHPTAARAFPPPFGHSELGNARDIIKEIMPQLCGPSRPMNITEIFIKRPVMTALVMIGIILFGIAGYRALPVSDLPNVDFPTIQVSANLPGASRETMASAVATPLERQFATVSGIDSMTSSSGVGATS